MAKKKSKKKEDKKKDVKKKKILSAKIKKKKKSKKKDSKKKDSKKKSSKKKKPVAKKPEVKVEVGKPVSASPAAPVASKAPVVKSEDHSSNYNVKEAVIKLRSLKSKEDLLSFTKGEKRLTVTKATPAAMNRF